jgi:hypothetical protein
MSARKAISPSASCPSGRSSAPPTSPWLACVSQPLHAWRDRDAGPLAGHDLEQAVQPTLGRLFGTIDAGLENRLAVEVAARAEWDRHRVQNHELVAIPRLA